MQNDFCKKMCCVDVILSLINSKQLLECNYNFLIPSREQKGIGGGGLREPNQFRGTSDGIRETQCHNLG